MVRLSKEFSIRIQGTETITSITKCKRFKFLKVLNNTASIRSPSNKGIISDKIKIKSSKSIQVF